MLICLDAGHGLTTPGKRCLKSIDPNETREWVLNSRIASHAEALLRAYDCSVLRVDDVTGARDISAQARVKAANDAKADVYVSIHHNAGVKGGSGGGVVVFRAPGSSETSEELQAALYQSAVKYTGLKGNRSDPTPENGYFVLKYTRMPAVLIEAGFMDSTTDTPVILTERHAYNIAAAIVEALVEACGLKEVETVTKAERPSIQWNGTEFTAKIPAAQFRLVLADTDKRKWAGNYCNAGYFGTYHENGKAFTLPSGHLTADYEATNAYTRKYCEERGKFSGDKFSFSSYGWAYQNEFYGNPVSTLQIVDGKACIREVAELTACDYAVTGVPVRRTGAAVQWADVKKQGWGTGPMRPTYHIFIGLKDDGFVYVMGRKTTTDNLIASGEGARLFSGFRDVIKLDGGGSYYAQAGGVKKTTGGSRRICSMIDLGGNPYKEPTAVIKRNSLHKEGVKWLQWELNHQGYPVDIDGKFGPATETALKQYQSDNGLDPDGKCGPATRAALKK